MRAGRLSDISRLEEAKSRLAKLYVADVARLRASASYMQAHEPKLLKARRDRHTVFHAQLQVNLTVLATAHAVGEGIVRGVAAEINLKSRPQVYGSTGRHVSGRASQATPMSVARSL